MFMFRFSFGTVAVLFLTLAMAIFGLVTAGAVALGWACAAVTLLGLLMVADPERTMRRTGAAILGTVVLGIALFIHLGTAHASAAVDLGGALINRPAPTLTGIAAPPGDDGFWAWINGYLTEGVILVVGTVLTWTLTQIATRTRFQLRTDQEASLRETLKTGAFATMSELELQIDKRWTPEQRQAVIAKMVSWAESRATVELRKLGLPGIVVNAMAGKVLEGLLTAYPFLDVSSGSSLISDGNPGSTPALDRAVGGNGGN